MNKTKKNKYRRNKTIKSKKGKKIKAIFNIFRQYYPKIFPSGYFRFLMASIDKHIHNKTIIYKNGVVLTWNIYKKTVRKGNKCVIKPGDLKIKQLVNKNQGNGKAKDIFIKFINKHKDKTLWLEVRKDNRRAIKFYNKNGFRKVCNTTFGGLRGIIMRKNN